MLRPELLKQVEALLKGGQAHTGFHNAVAAMPFELQGRVPEGLPYSAWQILEHLRITQRDILDFSDNAAGGYRERQWPADYWPQQAVPPDGEAWERCCAAIDDDRERFMDVLEDGNLTAAFAWGDGQNLLREALLIADHMAYHLGELVVVRRLLGAWPPK